MNLLVSLKQRVFLPKILFKFAWRSALNTSTNSAFSSAIVTTFSLLEFPSGIECLGLPVAVLIGLTTVFGDCGCFLLNFHTVLFRAAEEVRSFYVELLLLLWLKDAGAIVAITTAECSLTMPLLWCYCPNVAADTYAVGGGGATVASNEGASRGTRSPPLLVPPCPLVLVLL